MDTATDITIEHYQRPEVKEIITRFTENEDCTWRALNGDFNTWYRYSNDGMARLLNTDQDYDYITSRYRTLYATLNVFDPGLWTDGRQRAAITADNPLGSPKETAAYTLGVDIDKGHGRDIEDVSTKTAVEAAARFLVDYLKSQGIHQSVWVSFSGGGIYVEIHHELCRPKTIEGRAEFYGMATDCFNRLIQHVSEEFFKVHPEHVGWVKFDALNNSKRVFKCILAIHKSKPYAVTPLNRDAINIDFERARVPLADDMVAEAGAWYSSYDPAEREPLLKTLDEFRETEEERKRSERHFSEIWRSSIKIDDEHFPPCMRHIITEANDGEGKTRFAAVMASFLYQMGWDEDEAWTLIKGISGRNGLSDAEHIFDSCFGRISCPSCKTIKEDGAGYPHLGLNGLGACRPTEGCDRWPGDYSINKVLGEQPGESDSGTISEEDLNARPKAENPALEVRLEPDNLITLYMRYGSKTCDAYPEYHYTSALSLTSICTNRNVVLRMSQDDLFPNIWAMNLGKTTVSRKSAAVSKFNRFAEDLFPFAALPQSYSPEGLLEELTEKSRGYLVKDEAAAMIEAMEKNYMLEMRDIYCILYDCKGYRRKIRSNQRNKQSEFGAKDPFINILCATTGEAFSKHTSLLDLTSGWLLRFIYTFPTYKKPYMHFKPICDEDQSAYAEVLSRLSYLKGLLFSREDALEIELEPEAWAYYQVWQEQREGELVDIGDDIQLAFFGRLAFTALKMSILFTVGRADYTEETTVSLAHVQEACRQADSYFIPIGRIIADFIAMDEANNLQEKVLATLGRTGGRLKWSDLMRKIHVDRDKLDKSISALVESEEVEDLKVEKKGQKPMRWILLRQLNKYKSQSLKRIRYVESKVSKGSNISDISKVSKVSMDSKSSTGTPANIANFANNANFANFGKDDGEDDNPSPTLGKIDRPTPTRKEADPERERSKAGMKKRHCLKCGRDFSYDLGIHYLDGYMCTSCHFNQTPEPMKHNPQTVLCEEGST